MTAERVQPYENLFPIMSDTELRIRFKMHFEQRKGRAGRPSKGDEYIGIDAIKYILDTTRLMSNRQFTRFLNGGDPYRRKHPTFFPGERRRISKLVYEIQTGIRYRDGNYIRKRKFTTKPLPQIMMLDVLAKTPTFRPLVHEIPRGLPKMLDVFGANKDDNQRISMLGARGLRVGRASLPLGMQGNKR